ncbi:MAG: ABC transporter ATP-binding protein [Candidatus Rokubacteria bacterium]|nr:ABC transporter ATP-binding protein [Candidatus Rokubacteria bacterium]
MQRYLLETIRLKKHFGGVRAVDGVDLQVEEGELLAIIGPNGAGKTTLFNLLTGMLRPDSGRVLLAGKDITGLPASEIVRHGIGRSFQLINIFPELTVHENTLVAVLSHLGLTSKPLASLNKAKGAHAKATELLARVGLLAEADRWGGSLSRGDQKRLEIAIALAVEPKLLLLDEPTAGMAPVEIQQITRLLTRIAQEAGITVVFTEHDMRVVFSVASRITVMHQGKIIATGRPEEVRVHPGVQEAYLGETP